MPDLDYETIRSQAKNAAKLLMENATPERERLLVIGCSTSEILGQHIGSASSEEVAVAVMDGILPVFEAAGIYVAVQGCEHINRALCVERETAERFGLSEVWVEPWLHAGGAFSTEAAKRFRDHVMVEDLKGQATLGIDIGGTMIGMHMRAVVVPIHAEQKRIGEATLIMAKSRPKYVGGPRAHYPSGAAAR